MIEYWVGVDGGGTHTRARIRDRAGKLLGEGHAAGSNLELGIPHAHANVLAAIASTRLGQLNLIPPRQMRSMAPSCLPNQRIFHVYTPDPHPGRPT